MNGFKFRFSIQYVFGRMTDRYKNNESMEMSKL
jgi:hypothetical protein